MAIDRIDWQYSIKIKTPIRFDICNFYEINI